MTSQTKILVTGASGFIGSQVVEHLLEAGYAVRGTSRSNKAKQMRQNCPHPNFDATVVDDLIAGDFSEALKDVKAVIHVASPLIGEEDPIGVAIGGTMNIIRQAQQAKVFKITLISSYAAIFTTSEDLTDDSRVLSDKDWRKVEKEDIKPDTPPLEIYAASKALAERAAWEFSDAHPELDLITILPSFVFGPLGRSHVLQDPAALSTNALLYQLISRPVPSYPSFSSRHSVDIRDVAKAAVLTLSATKRHPGEQRRILLYGESFTWREAVRHVAHVRPKLKSRLVDGGEPPEDEVEVTRVTRLDTSRAKEILGFSTFIGWKQSVVDAVDSMVEREAIWSV